MRYLSLLLVLGFASGKQADASAAKAQDPGAPTELYFPASPELEFSDLNLSKTKAGSHHSGDTKLIVHAQESIITSENSGPGSPQYLYTLDLNSGRVSEDISGPAIPHMIKLMEAGGCGGPSEGYIEAMGHMQNVVDSFIIGNAPFDEPRPQLVPLSQYLAGIAEEMKQNCLEY